VVKRFVYFGGIMQAKWLIRQGRDHLLLFFNGWGMDELPLGRLSSLQYDILMLFDYRNLDWPELARAAVAEYPRRDLAAWSMGVWAAGQVWEKAQPSGKSLAINGTLFPIHADYGIDPAIFDATLARLARTGSRSFYNNMFSCKEDFEAFYPIRPQRPFAEQHNELLQLQNAMVAVTGAAPAPFSDALIGSRDIIVPAKRQLRFWRERPGTRIRIEKTGHFPFFLWQQWEELFHERNVG
jgi:biotin synthesis protein BioG